MNIKGRLYRIIMKIAHRYNWHYAPPIFPEGDTQLWCKWCGFRQTVAFKYKVPEDAQYVAYQELGKKP